ncbi:MAG TPA: tRNA adenosine(34) deaminase TadA [Gemmatimonadaceae bacterium]|nr:tRNA adenosine(34) deaminase TadA [Gemmatimonadaceae bacterium]
MSRLRDEEDRRWMAAAMEEARAAAALGEVPVGAVVVCDGALVAGAGNRTVTAADPTAHAEVLALRAAAAARSDWRLAGCTLYVTLEPCAMCAGAIVLSRLDRVVFGAWDPKAGMAGSVGDLLRHPRLNHRPQVAGGACEDECGALLREFFDDRRDAETVDTAPRDL